MRVLALLLVAGCDVVFSLDRPPSPVDAPPPGPDLARATFVRAILAEPGGAVLDRSAPDVTATVVLANGARPEVTRAGDDFTFAWTRGMGYRIKFERPDRAPLEYISDAEHLVHAQRELAREGATPSAGSLLDVTMTNIGTPLYTFVMSTGVWTMSSSGGQMPAQFTVDFSLPGPFLSARPRLLAATDTLYCATFETVLDGGGGLTYDALTRVTSGNVAMLDGQRTPVSCNVDEIVLDRCARIDVDRQAEADRVQSAAAPSFNSIAYSTFLIAVPTPAFGPWAGFWLAFNATRLEPIVPFNGTLHYANPFPGHTDAVLSSSSRTRDIQAPGAVKTFQIGVGTMHFYQPTPACGAATPVTQIAIPSPPAFGGAYVVNDGELQLSTTRPVEVSWENRSPGPVDYYLVVLFRVIKTADAGTALQDVYSWVTTGTELEMDRTLLEGGKQYIMSISALYGYSNSANGDFRTQRWPDPVASATNYSGVFTVKP